MATIIMYVFIYAPLMVYLAIFVYVPHDQEVVIDKNMCVITMLCICGPLAVFLCLFFLKVLQ